MMRQSLPQWVLDVLFVLVLPPLCFWFDPVVFYEIMSGIARPHYFLATVTYFGIGLSILLFFVGRFAGERLSQRSRDMLSGFLLSSAVFALVIGIVLLLLSVMTMMLGIGLLGLVPLVTGWRYWRISRQLTGARWPVARLLAGMLLIGTMLTSAVTLALHPIPAHIAAVGEGDPAALDALADHPLCRSHCTRAAFDAICDLERFEVTCPDAPAMRDGFERLSGKSLGWYARRVEMAFD